MTQSTAQAEELLPLTSPILDIVYPKRPSDDIDTSMMLRSLAEAAIREHFEGDIDPINSIIGELYTNANPDLNGNPGTGSGAERHITRFIMWLSEGGMVLGMGDSDPGYGNGRDPYCDAQDPELQSDDLLRRLRALDPEVADAPINGYGNQILGAFADSHWCIGESKYLEFVRSNRYNTRFNSRDKTKKMVLARISLISSRSGLVPRSRQGA